MYFNHESLIRLIAPIKLVFVSCSVATLLFALLLVGDAVYRAARCVDVASAHCLNLLRAAELSGEGRDIKTPEELIAISRESRRISEEDATVLLLLLSFSRVKFDDQRLIWASPLYLEELAVSRQDKIKMFETDDIWEEVQPKKPLKINR